VQTCMSPEHVSIQPHGAGEAWLCEEADERALMGPPQFECRTKATGMLFSALSSFKKEYRDLSDLICVVGGAAAEGHRQQHVARANRFVADYGDWDGRDVDLKFYGDSQQWDILVNFVTHQFKNTMVTLEPGTISMQTNDGTRLPFLNENRLLKGLAMSVTGKLHIFDIAWVGASTLMDGHPPAPTCWMNMKCNGVSLRILVETLESLKCGYTLARDNSHQSLFRREKCLVKLDEISSWNSTKLSDGNGKSEGASGSYGKYGPSETQVEKCPLGSSQYKSLLALPDARQAYLQRKSRRKSIAKNALVRRRNKVSKTELEVLTPWYHFKGLPKNSCPMFMILGLILLGLMNVSADAEESLPHFSCTASSEYACPIVTEHESHIEACAKTALLRDQLCKLRDGALTTSCEALIKHHHNLCIAPRTNWKHVSGLKSENGLEASITLLETTAGFDGSEHAAKVSELSMKADKINAKLLRLLEDKQSQTGADPAHQNTTGTSALTPADLKNAALMPNENVSDAEAEFARNTSVCDVTSTSFINCLRSTDKDCAHGVGTDSTDKIPDTAITASGQLYNWSLPWLARLGNTGRTWFPANNDVSAWVMYNLGEVRTITGMKAEGAPNSGCGDPDCMFCIMRRFRLEYSTDQRSWIALATKVGEASAVFWNNVERQDGRQKPYQTRAPVAYTFPDPDYTGLTPFEARYIRVHLVMAGSTGMNGEYSGNSAIQMEFYGPQCQSAATVPVGIGSYAIPDSALTQNETYGGSQGTQSPSKARLNTDTNFHALFKGAGGSPAGYQFRNQLWLQVDLGGEVVIGAVATQGSADQAASSWSTADYTMTEYKLGGSIDGATFTMQTDVLQATSDGPTVVVKNYVAPFAAHYVRLYPWEGANEASVVVRMELYAVATKFAWLDLGGLPVLNDHTRLQGLIGSNSFCNHTMLDLAPSFQAWTEGMNGDATIYESDAHAMVLDGVDYVMTAYQRRSVKFLGMMSKQLVCFTALFTGAQKCCVNKQATSLERGIWDKQEAEIKMS